MFFGIACVFTCVFTCVPPGNTDFNLCVNFNLLPNFGKVMYFIQNNYVMKILVKVLCIVIVVLSVSSCVENQVQPVYKTNISEATTGQESDDGDDPDDE